MIASEKWCLFSRHLNLIVIAPICQLSVAVFVIEHHKLTQQEIKE